MGWRGSAIHWHRYEMAYLFWRGWPRRWWFPFIRWSVSILPSALIPGWHSTIFPPYFVAGAIFRLRHGADPRHPAAQTVRPRRLHHLRHLKNMGEVMLATGLIVAYGYLMETFMAWYSGNIYEQYMMWNRMFGPYW